MTDSEIISAILVREGGGRYTDVPADRGGPTKYGITQAALAEYRGHAVTPEDVKALTETEARAIYRQDYIVGPRLDQIADDLLRATAVDTAVNHGPSTAIKMLQYAVGAVADGVMGPQTIALANTANGRRAAIRLLCERARVYARIVEKNPTQVKFLEGWINRAMAQIEGLA